MIPSGFVSWLMNNMPWPKWLCFLVVCHDPSGFVSWLYAVTQVALFIGYMPWPKCLYFLVVCHEVAFVLGRAIPYPKGLCILQGKRSLNWSFLHNYLQQSKDQRRFRYSFFVCLFLLCLCNYFKYLTLWFFGALTNWRGVGVKNISHFLVLYHNLKILQNLTGKTSW